MSTKVRNLLIAIAILIALAIGFGVRDWQARSEIDAAHQAANSLISELGTVQQNLTVVRNEKVSADEALKKALADNAKLVDQLATMHAKVQDLRAVIRSTGKLEAKAPQVVTVATNVPAPAHVFETTDGLVVAELAVAKNGENIDYTYTTHDLQFETSVVLTTDKASVDVLVATSANPENKIRVVQETKSLVVPPVAHKVLKAQASIGATLHMSLNPELMGSVTLHWLHPHKSVDVLSPRVSGSGETFVFGIDALHYNIADPIPVLDNLWLGFGADITHRGEWGGSLTLGAKL